MVFGFSDFRVMGLGFRVLGSGLGLGLGLWVIYALLIRQ